MATHSSILAWGIPWTEEPGRLQSMESQRVRHNWATKHIQVHRYTWIPTQSVWTYRLTCRISLLWADVYYFLHYGLWGPGELCRDMERPQASVYRCVRKIFVTVSSSLLAIHRLHYAYTFTLEARTAMHLGPPQFWESDFLIRSSVLCVAQACGVHHLHHLTVSLCLTVLNLLFHVVYIFFLALSLHLMGYIF